MTDFQRHDNIGQEWEGRNLEEYLDNVKEKAIGWLNVPLEIAPPIGMGFISHPFFNSPFAQDKKGIFSMLTDRERAEGVINGIEDTISRQDSIHGVLCLINKPYRIDFLKELFEEGGIDKKTCGNELGQIWPMLENNDSTDDETKEIMLDWLLSADKEVIMDENDLKAYMTLPEQVTVYRGMQPGESVKGFSWSLDLSTAEWFSKRFSNDGKVYSTVVNKKDIIAYINSRAEQEVILNYKIINEPVLL